jgi:hypothetical protein
MKPINLPLFSDHYTIDQSGLIYSTRRKNPLVGKIDRYGYKVVLLCVSGNRKHITVHRLVALTFIPNPENKPTVNHKDGNKQNNCVDNLEWATFQENTKHSYDTGLSVAWNKGKENCYSDEQIKVMRSVQTSKKVKCIDKLGNEMLYPSINDLLRNQGLDKRTVQRVLRKQRHFKTVKGFKIEYA